MKFIKNNIIFFSLLLSSSLLWQSCSTEKNAFPNRAYHNVNTRYNVYFNARESLKDGIMTLEAAHKDDYTKILPIKIYPDDNSANAIFPQMDRTIEKSSKAIQKHSMFIKKKEYNKWIDECYMEMGKAHFYKRDFGLAIENFEYLSKIFKDEDEGFVARLWLTRTYIQQDKLDKANSMLDKLSYNKKFPETMKKEYSEVYADFYMKQKNYNLAIPELKSVLEQTKKRKHKARLTFIIAQLYQAIGNYSEASGFYAQTLKLNPDYEMQFYAKINQAMSYDGSGNSATIKKQLRKLAKDGKNKEFLDQIYYAMAEIELKEGHREEGIKYLKLSAEKSVSNKNQKGISFLKLGDLYFENPDYRQAQAYFDSATISLNPDHPHYERTLNKRNSLTRLVKNINTIEREDSLLNFATLPDREKRKIINTIIQDVLDKEQLERQQKANAQTSQLTQTNQNGKGEWYFYNPSTLSFGAQDFKKKWGDRTLEDNWRRKNKSVTAFSSEEDPRIGVLEPMDSSQTASENDLKNPAFYLKDVPDTKEKVSASHNNIIEAYYDLGVIYKDQLQDNDKAVETFEELIKRYDTCRYVSTAYYQLYRLFLSENNEPRAGYYKHKILTEFPESDYAKIIQNPNYAKDKEKDKSRLLDHYKSTYAMYTNELYASTVKNCMSADSLFPDNYLLPKFHYLHALSLGKLQGKDALIVALQDLTQKYAGDEVATKAKETLEYLTKTEPESKENLPKIEKKALYSKEITGKHTYVLIIPSDRKDINRIKISIANFNSKYFRLSNLKISSVELDEKRQMISIKKFDDNEKAMEYHRAFVQNTDFLKEITESKDNSFFPITYDNYAIFYQNKNTDEYIGFFKESYPEN